LRELCEPGTPDAACGALLQEQGLELRGERHAQQAWGGYPCQYFVEADWQVDAEGRINGISGNYGATCT
jgi:lysophospholipase L1-like esterase